MPKTKRSEGVKRLSDATLVKLARKFDTFREAEKENAAEKKEVQAQILDELKRRGTKAIERAGVRINRAAQRRTNYDIVAAEVTLGPRRFKKLTKRVIDPEAVTAALASGLITADELAEFAETVETAAYITVSFIEE